MSIKVKLKIKGVKTKFPTTVDRLSAVILAPPKTLLGNPEEIMFKRVGEFDYEELESGERDFIRNWCSSNKITGTNLTLTVLDKILALYKYQQQKLEEIRERSEGEG